MATAPLGTPAAGIVYRFEDVPDRPRLQTLNFVPLLLGRAATSGRSTAMFGFNVVSASYDAISDLQLDALPVATFQGPAPIVTSSVLDLSVDTLTVTGFATVGLTDHLDLAVAVPFVGVTLRGSMVQQEAAIGTALFPVDASSYGVGDVGSRHNIGSGLAPTSPMASPLVSHFGLQRGTPISCWVSMRGEPWCRGPRQRALVDCPYTERLDTNPGVTTSRSRTCFPPTSSKRGCSRTRCRSVVGSRSRRVGRLRSLSRPSGDASGRTVSSRCSRCLRQRPHSASIRPNFSVSDQVVSRRPSWSQGSASTSGAPC